jgi:hypothetical protein
VYTCTELEVGRCDIVLSGTSVLRVCSCMCAYIAVYLLVAWRDNPTVYRYGYLWSVHSLYYWWRDQGIAEAGTVQAASSPCYLNRMDTTEIAMGFGKSVLEMLRAFVNKYSPFVLGFPLELVNCAAPAPREYKFPRDLYHYD